PETGGFFPNVVAHGLSTGSTIGFTAAQTLNGRPGISADGNLIVANSNFALDPMFASRGIFVFSATPPPRLGNISTRGQVLTNNDVMIAGFIIGGSTAKTVVVNVAGPSLTPFGITNALAD